MNPNYLYDLMRQQPLRSDLMDPVGIPQTLSGVIAMENARNYAPAQYKFSPEQAQQFDQMAAAGQADLGKWANQVKQQQMQEREMRMKEAQLANSLKPKYELLQTEQGMFRVDPNTGTASPVTLAGQTQSAAPAGTGAPAGGGGQQSAGMPEQPAAFGAKVKPLGEGQKKQLTGIGSLQGAIQEYRDELKNWDWKDIASPDKRAAMGVKYNNMMLQAKEAYNLGVLNGPDYQILTSVVTDPTTLKGAITSNKALDKQAAELDRIMGGVAGNVLRPGSGIGANTNPSKKKSGRTIVRTGTHNGRRVAEYSDGTTDYVD